MSTSAIAASAPASLAALYGAGAKASHRHGGHGGGHCATESSGDGQQDQGMTVLASLLQALTQAASGTTTPIRVPGTVNPGATGAPVAAIGTPSTSTDGSSSTTAGAGGSTTSGATTGNTGAAAYNTSA